MQDITLLNATFYDVPAVRLPKASSGYATFTDVTDTTAAAADVAQGKHFYTSSGVRTAGTASGGGGASNFVTGTFTTGSSTSTVGSITVPYTGTGYPVMLVIVIEGGMYNPDISGWYTSLTRYAVGQITIGKGVATSTPSYTTSGTDNYGSVELIFKNSTSSSTSYSSTRSVTANSYSSSNANGTSYTCVRWKGNKSISYRTSGGSSSSYGLLVSTTYRYYVIYSA